MRFALLFLLLSSVPSSFHWTTTHDVYRVHQRYVNSYGNVMGEYFQPKPNSHQFPVQSNPITAQCYDGPPHEFSSEAEAKAFVSACPLWD